MLLGFRMDEVNNEDQDGGTVFSLYSLSRHEVVRRPTVADRAVEFEANEEVVVIVRCINFIC
jgi:hypothetical protein